MNGNVPLLLHASVPPLRQAPCHSYSINHSIKQSNIQRFTFLPMPSLPLLHSHAHMHTHSHTLWKGKTKRSIRAHCVSSNHGTMKGIGMEKFVFFSPSNCCNIDFNFARTTVLKHKITCMHMKV